MDSESVPLPGQSVPVAQLNNALRKELVGNTLNSHSDLLERLLPCERLPFPVDEDLLRRLSAPIGTHQLAEQHWYDYGIGLGLPMRTTVVEW
jgi:hypothetical protein